MILLCIKLLHHSIINKLNKEDGMTIIMIYHDLNGSLKYASNVLNVGENNDR